MKVQEVEEKINTRITGLEHQETKLHEWLECIRQVGEIAEKMGYARPKNQVEEGGLMQAFEELVEQADLEETSSVEVVQEEAQLQGEESVEQTEPEECAADLSNSEESEKVGADPVQEAEEERPSHLEVPDEGNLDQLRAALSNSQGEKNSGKKGIGSFISAFLSTDEE